MLYFFAGLAFLAGFALVAGLNLMLIELMEDRKRHYTERAKEETRLRNAERARLEMATKEAQQNAVSQISKYMDNPTLWGKWKLTVAQSGIVGVKPETFVVIAACLVILSGTAVGLLSANVWFGIAAGLATGTIPFLYVKQKRNQRQKKLLSQLPDAYEMLSRVLRSGQTVSQAMRSIADEFSPPIAEEFAYCWEQQNLGLTPEASLKELARRTGVLEIKIFVVALTINSSAGGNLSNLLNKLSLVIRDRERMRQKILALTAEGRMQAYMLIGLPIGLAIVLSVLSPTYLSPLLDYKYLIFGTLGWMFVGFLWMQRIINLDQ